MFPGLRPQRPLAQADRDAKYLAFVSGMAVGDPSSNPTRLSLLLDFLTGMLGSSTEQATASKVSTYHWSWQAKFTLSTMC